jgi:cytochrome P450 family 110
MLPPGPRTPAFWQTYRYLSEPRAYSRAVVAKYGRASRFRVLNGDGLMLADPDLAREVFAADPETFETPPVLRDLFGPHSLLATAGAPHKRQRKLLNPRFHGSSIKAFVATMQRVIETHLAAFQRAADTGEVVVVSAFAQTLTLDIILETVFGDDPGMDRAEGRKVLIGLTNALSPSFVFTALLRTPRFPPWRRFVSRRAVFDAWVDRIIAERRARETLGSDVLGVMLEARYDDGGAMADAEIRDQVWTLLAAGHETTAVAIAWGVYWLLREPAVLARLRDEVGALGNAPAPEALGRLPYLDAIVCETLRIEPIVTDVSRRCRIPLRVGPWTVPQGDIVMVNVGAILDDAALFREPARFHPERFLEQTFGATQFLPFGGGSKRCLGAAFAQAELAIALATIASTWELQLASDAPERSTRRNITMGPGTGVRVRVLGPVPTTRAARSSCAT